MPVNTVERDVQEEQFVPEEQIPEIAIEIPQELLTLHEEINEINRYINKKLKNKNSKLSPFLNKYGREILIAYNRNLFVEKIGNKERSNGKKSKNIGAFFDQNGELNPNWNKDLPEYIEVNVKNYPRLFSTENGVTDEVLRDLNELQEAEYIKDKINEDREKKLQELQKLLSNFFEESYRKNFRHGRVVFVEALDLYLTKLIDENADVNTIFETLTFFVNKVDQNGIKADSRFQEIIEKILNKYEKTLTNNEAQVLLYFVEKFVKDSPTQDKIGDRSNTKQNLINDILRKCRSSSDDVLYFTDNGTISPKESANYLIANNDSPQIEKIIISILDTKEHDKKPNKNILLLLENLIGESNDFAYKTLNYQLERNIRKNGLGYYGALVKKLLLSNLSENEIVLIRKLIPAILAEKDDELKNKLRIKIKDIIKQSNSLLSKYLILKASVNNKLIDEKDYILEQSENIITDLPDNKFLRIETKVEILIGLKNINSEIDNVEFKEIAYRIISELPLEDTISESKVQILISLNKKGLLDPKDRYKEIIRKVILNDITRNDGKKEILSPIIFLSKLKALSEEDIFLAKDYGDDLRKDIFKCLVNNENVAINSFPSFFNLFPSAEYPIDILGQIKKIGDEDTKVKLVMSFLGHLDRTNKPEKGLKIIELLENETIQELFLTRRNAFILLSFIDDFFEGIGSSNNENHQEEYDQKLGRSPAVFAKATMNINKRDEDLVNKGLEKYPKIRELKEKLEKISKAPAKKPKEPKASRLSEKNRIRFIEN